MFHGDRSKRSNVYYHFTRVCLASPGRGCDTGTSDTRGVKGEGDKFYRKSQGKGEEKLELDYNINLKVSNILTQTPPSILPSFGIFQEILS